MFLAVYYSKRLGPRGSRETYLNYQAITPPRSVQEVEGKKERPAERKNFVSFGNLPCDRDAFRFGIVFHVMFFFAVVSVVLFDTTRMYDVFASSKCTLHCARMENARSEKREIEREKERKRGRKGKQRERERGMRATRPDHGRPILANAVVTVSLSSRLRERVGRRCVFNDHRNFLVRATLTRFPLPPSRSRMDHKSLNEGVKATKGRRRRREAREETGRVRHY